MAYLDDNNENLYTQGDPLEKLDRELADLKATLNNLEGDAPVPVENDRKNPVNRLESVPKTTRTETEPLPTAEPPVEQPAYRAEKPSDTEEDMKQHSNKPAHTAKKTGGSHRVLLIITAVVLSAALIIAAGYAAFRLLTPKSDSDAPVSSGEMVTINDSVMGDIELQTVKGAEINTYTAENLVTDENGIPAYYENGKKISHLGVDLSEFQGEVDFTAMKNAGVEFVMLRIGGRYYGEDGGMYEDRLFDTNYEAAKAAGLKVGAYFFSQANSAEDAKAEAQFALNKLGDKQLSYPIALDWENIAEDNARTDNVTGDELTAIAETFCDTITAAGYKSIVYSNTQQMFIMYDFETMKDYDFWLADYREFPNMYYKFDMWQYTADGKIDGVEGTVDLNLSFTDFS